MKHWWLLVLLVLLAGLFFAFDLGRFLSLEMLKTSRDELRHAYHTRPFQVVGLYSAAYILIAALSLPGGALMTMAGGAIFGLPVGASAAVFSASVGATLAFWTARYVFRDSIKQRFGSRMAAIDAGIKRDGAFYLFTLRLVPIFPFFLINLLMGLTVMRTMTFFWVSLVGMLAGTILYANAGTRLSELSGASDILSPAIIFSFALLAAFPWLSRWGLGHFRAKRVQAGWVKPARFDRNLIVIGAGPAGLVASFVAASVRARVTLIESDKMGGDCLNFGCVPSKALIRSAAFLHQSRHARDLGIARTDVEYSFREVMARVHRIIHMVEPHDSVERYKKLGVEVIHGSARITSPWSVQVNGQTLTTRAIVIATGSRPVIPPIPGLDKVKYFTSDTIWSLTERPERLVVLGGGPVGCELAQAFVRLDCQVTQVEQGRLMSREDEDAATLVEAALRGDGIRVLTQTNAVRCGRNGIDQFLMVRHQDGTEEAIPFDAILCATGRTPRTDGFGLEELGIPISENRTIETDEWLQTLYPNIYACGDVAGPYQFTHVAGYQGWYASVNALFGGLKRFRPDYSVIPWTTFTDPEVGRAGLSEGEAKKRGIAYEVTRYNLAELDRAITDEAPHGFIKIVSVPGKDRILGVTIVGAHAGEILAEFVLAMKQGIGLNKILATIHAYPTWTEAGKNAAGEWRRSHMPNSLLKWAEKYLAWRRG
jgi:pyruvate/2-oxoglutarate dehydrogenase complex dihydrolipoamide dehydrogenase (E3) component/uncharacterized membrane protein YdjX (TVP38/TMEM64 family)